MAEMTRKGKEGRIRRDGNARLDRAAKEAAARILKDLQPWMKEMVRDLNSHEYDAVRYIVNAQAPVVKFDKAMRDGEYTFKTFVTESGMIVMEDITEDVHKKPVDTSAEER